MEVNKEVISLLSVTVAHEWAAAEFKFDAESPVVLPRGQTSHKVHIHRAIAQESYASLRFLILLNLNLSHLLFSLLSPPSLLLLLQNPERPHLNLPLTPAQQLPKIAVLLVVSP